MPLLNPKKSISVIIPVYGCNLSLLILHEKLSRVLATLTPNYEIIFINDASPDDSWSTISNICSIDNHAVGINLSRNFGQHYAITAGLSYCTSDYAVIMDCDLQDPPEEIPLLFNKISEGYNSVFGIRKNRNDSYIKKLTSRVFFIILNKLSSTKFDYRVANFSIIDRKVINALLSLNEKCRTYSALVSWVGFKTTKIEVRHSEREQGKTTYTLSKSLALATDLIVMQSDKLLRISIRVGFILSLLSLFYGFFILAQFFLFNITVPGWTTIVVTINFLFGSLFINLGIIGLYIGKIFEELKKRPLYIVDEIINFRGTRDD